MRPWIAAAVLVLLLPLPAVSSGASTLVDVEIRSGGAFPWHVEVLPGTTIKWTLQDPEPTTITAPDGTEWCQLTVLEPTCTRTFAALGHHGYLILQPDAYGTWGRALSSSALPGPGLLYQREKAAVNVLADLDIEIIDFANMIFNDDWAFSGATKILFVFDGWRGEGAIRGPNGFLCNFDFTGQFCSTTLADLGAYVFRTYDRQNPGPGAWVRDTVTIYIQGAPPTLTIDAPADGSVITGAFTMSGTAAAEASVTRVEVKVGSRAWDAAAGATVWTYTADIEGLAEGPLPVSVRATAADGQQATTNLTLELTVPGTSELSITRFRAADWARPGADLGCSHGACAIDPVAFQYPYLLIDSHNAGTRAVTALVAVEYRERGQWHPLLEFNVTLQPGETDQSSVWWVDPLRFGSWPVRATIDADDRFDEVDETDNRRQRTVHFPMSTGSWMPAYRPAWTVEAIQDGAERSPLGELV